MVQSSAVSFGRGLTFLYFGSVGSPIRSAGKMGNSTSGRFNTVSSNRCWRNDVTVLGTSEGTKNDGPPMSSIQHQGQRPASGANTCIGSILQALRRLISSSSSCIHCSGDGRKLPRISFGRNAASNKFAELFGKSSNSKDAGGGST